MAITEMSLISRCASSLQPELPELCLRAGTEGRAEVGAYKEPVNFSLGFLAVSGGIIKNTLKMIL